MFQNMAASLIRYERIQTTDQKAKALRGFVEPLVTLAKRGDLHSRRLVGSRLQDADGTTKLFSELAERMRERPGGYTRIIKVGRRKGDNAAMSLIEWVDADLEKIMEARGLDEDDIYDGDSDEDGDEGEEEDDDGDE
jgi:large subunit ribosomal protein L17